MTKVVLFRRALLILAQIVSVPLHNSRLTPTPNFLGRSRTTQGPVRLEWVPCRMQERLRSWALTRPKQFPELLHGNLRHRYNLPGVWS